MIGLGRARDLVLTARRVAAAEALQMGLANRVSEPGQSVEAAIALGKEIAQNAPISVASAKGALEDAWDLALDAGLQREREWYEKPLASADRLEGLKAFSERRPPEWKGK